MTSKSTQTGWFGESSKRMSPTQEPPPSSKGAGFASTANAPLPVQERRNGDLGSHNNKGWANPAAYD